MTEGAWSHTLDDAPETHVGIVLAQADTTQAQATGMPRALVEVEEEDLADDEAVLEAPAPAIAAPAAPAPTVAAEPQAAGEVPALDIAPLAAGERRVVEVAPGSLVSLDDAAFDPSAATYAVDGFDLVVTLANGGVLVLAGFFAPSEAPPRLSVLDAPATTADTLLARAEAAPVLDSAVEPASGQTPGAGEEVVGGASNFRAYDQGSIGDGLDAQGPLGPTELAYGAGFGEGNILGLTELAVLSDTGSGPGPDPEPTQQPPEVSLIGNPGTIVEQDGPPYEPAVRPTLPIRGDGVTVPSEEVNNVDQRNLTLDIDREVFVQFIDESSRSIDSLFVYEINDAGEMVNVSIVFEGVNKPGEPHAALNTEPGAEFSLGTYAAGTKLGFVSLNDGYRENDFSALEGGHYELVNPGTGDISKITDRGDQPLLVHVADDGTRTVLNGTRYFTADASQDTPNDNRLNPDGKGRFVSGWDEEQGLLVIGHEDGGTARPADHPYYTSGLDYDYNDLVFGVRYGTPSEKVLVFGDAAIGVTITDADSEVLAAASIALTGLPGDRLVLDPAVLEGTGITFEQLGDKLILLTGEAPIAAYEAAINATGITIDHENPQAGSRQVTVSAEDTDGNTGQGITIVEIRDETVGIVTLDQAESEAAPVATAALDGGNEIIDLGEDAEIVRLAGLTETAPTLRNFDATAGDRLDLSEIFKDSDLSLDTLGDLVRVVEGEDGLKVQVDIDGFVDVAVLLDPVGVTPGVDVSSFVTTAEIS